MKPIGYSNKKPGDESTDIVPVFDLTSAQAVTHVQATAAAALVKKLEKELSAAQDRLDQIQTKCTHHVHRDEGGFPYDQRYCVLCGAYRGML
jgi:hypothetical protein